MSYDEAVILLQEIKPKSPNSDRYLQYYISVTKEVMDAYGLPFFKGYKLFLGDRNKSIYDPKMLAEIK